MGQIQKVLKKLYILSGLGTPWSNPGEWSVIGEEVWVSFLDLLPLQPNHR